LETQIIIAIDIHETLLEVYGSNVNKITRELLFLVTVYKISNVSLVTLKKSMLTHLP